MFDSGWRSHKGIWLAQRLDSWHNDGKNGKIPGMQNVQTQSR